MNFWFWYFTQRNINNSILVSLLHFDLSKFIVFKILNSAGFVWIYKKYSNFWNTNSLNLVMADFKAILIVIVVGIKWVYFYFSALIILGNLCCEYFKCKYFNINLRKINT